MRFPLVLLLQLLYRGDGALGGIATGDMGVSKSGAHKAGRYTPGVDLHARATLLAEGARGSLSQVGLGMCMHCIAFGVL